MAARSGTVPWFESFDVEVEVEDLLTHIERCTGFALPAQQRAVIMSHATAKLDKNRQAYLEAKAAGKPVSISRRAYLTEPPRLYRRPFSSSQATLSSMFMFA